MLLLASLHAFALVAFAPPPHHTPLAFSRRAPIAVAMDDMSKPPPEVVEAEANATPNRKFRLVGCGVGFGVSLGSGILSFNVLTGNPDAQNLRDLVLFDNPIISLLVDIIIGGTCAWAFQQEIKTRDENQRRIWEEVKRRRAGGAASGANRSQRRAKKVVDTRKAQFTGGGGFNSPPPPPPAPPPPPPPAAPPMADAAEGGGEGLFEKAKSFFEEANEMGKASALVLNAQLEEKGVLSPIAQPVPKEEAEEVAVAEAPAPATEVVQADAAVASAPPKAKGAAGGKGKKKRKKRSKK